MLKKTPEIELIKFTAQEAVEGRKDSRIRGLLNASSLNWARAKESAEYHEINSFVYPAIKEFNSFVPVGLMEFFKVSYFGSMLISQYFWREFLEIFNKFKERSIQVLPIKGISFLADIYAANPCRSMTDIDLLVKEEDLKEAKEVFLTLGYEERLDGLTEEYWLKKQCHLEFFKRAGNKTFFVDLHFGLDFKRKGRKMLPLLWDRAREVNMDGKSISLLSPEDALFSLALHQRRFGNILNLKNILDAAMLLKKYGNSFDWEYLLREAKNGRIRSNIFFILTQTKIFFGADIPGFVWKSLNVHFYKRILIKHLIEKYTFSLNKEMKGVYLRAHFLLYDNLWEPVEYIINIPKEQFAKFYCLETYTKKTDFLYRCRLLYMPFRGICGLLKRAS